MGKNKILGIASILVISLLSFTIVEAKNISPKMNITPHRPANNTLSKDISPKETVPSPDRPVLLRKEISPENEINPTSGLRIDISPRMATDPTPHKPAFLRKEISPANEINPYSRDRGDIRPADPDFQPTLLSDGTTVTQEGNLVTLQFLLRDGLQATAIEDTLFVIDLNPDSPLPNVVPFDPDVHLQNEIDSDLGTQTQ